MRSSEIDAIDAERRLVPYGGTVRQMASLFACRQTCKRAQSTHTVKPCWHASAQKGWAAGKVMIERDEGSSTSTVITDVQGNVYLEYALRARRGRVKMRRERLKSSRHESRVFIQIHQLLTERLT